MKRPRSCNDPIDCADLVADLLPLANLRKAPFDWHVAAYGKQRRSQGPDREGLEHYHALLDIVLDHAPTALPGQVPLRRCWMELDRKFDLMPQDLKEKRISPETWADEAATAIKLMCKHLLDLKSNPGSVASAKVRELLCKIVPAPPASWSSPAESSSMPLEDEPRRVLARVESEESVQFCGFECNCPSCYEVPVVAVPASQQSSSSEAAAGCMDVVPPAKGMVKAMVHKKPAAADTPPRQEAGPKATLTLRKNGKEQGDIMVDHKYMVGLSRSTCAEYETNLRTLQQKLNEGAVAPNKAACKRFLGIAA